MRIHQNSVPLSKDRHARFTLKRPLGYGFARHLNSAPLVAAEFDKAAHDHPIVFGPATGDAVAPVVILGLRNDENLCVDGNGQWTGGYIPGFLRQYPFVLARPAEDQQFVVCIDETAFDEGGPGPRIFDDEGHESEPLRQALAFLKEYHRQSLQTLELGRALKSSGLLQRMVVRYGEDHKDQTLGGFEVVDRARLAQLPAAEVERFHRAGWLELIHLHLHSLEKIAGLTRRVEAGR